MICAGHENRDSAKFCGACASSLIRDAACTVCGTSDPAGQKFCDQCGTALQDVAVSPNRSDPRSDIPKHLADRILQSKSALVALRELRRVLKPSGRLVVGEVFFDRDFVAFGSLAERVERASFSFERRLGAALSYLARFRPL